MKEWRSESKIYDRQHGATPIWGISMWETVCLSASASASSEMLSKSSHN